MRRCRLPHHLPFCFDVEGPQQRREAGEQHRLDVVLADAGAPPEAEAVVTMDTRVFGQGAAIGRVGIVEPAGRVEEFGGWVDGWVTGHGPSSGMFGLWVRWYEV